MSKWTRVQVKDQLCLLFDALASYMWISEAIWCLRSGVTVHEGYSIIVKCENIHRYPSCLTWKAGGLRTFRSNTVGKRAPEWWKCSLHTIIKCLYDNHYKVIHSPVCQWEVWVLTILHVKSHKLPGVEINTSVLVPVTCLRVGQRIVVIRILMDFADMLVLSFIVALCAVVYRLQKGQLVFLHHIGGGAAVG